MSSIPLWFFVDAPGLQTALAVVLAAEDALRFSPNPLKGNPFLHLLWLLFLAWLWPSFVGAALLALVFVFSFIVRNVGLIDSPTKRAQNIKQ